MKNQHVGYLANNELGEWSKSMPFSKALRSSYSLSKMYASPCSALSTVSCSRPSSSNSAARRQRTSQTSASSKSGNHSLELHSLNWKCSFFCPARCRILFSHHGRPQHIPAPIQSHGHQLTHGLLYIYCSFSHSAQFPLFNDTNKHILPNCIKDTVKGATNVTAHEFCNEPLIELLQEWCGGAGQVLDLDIQMSKVNILWMLPCIIKANKDFKHYILGLQLQLSNQPLLVWTTPSPNHQWMATLSGPHFQPYKIKYALSFF